MLVGIVTGARQLTCHQVPLWVACGTRLPAQNLWLEQSRHCGYNRDIAILRGQRMVRESHKAFAQTMSWAVLVICCSVRCRSRWLMG